MRVAAFLVVALVLGCHHGNQYRASALPPHLMAATGPSLKAVDLSRIASSTSDSELLHPGDVVEVTIATGLEEKEPTTWKLRVADDGSVNVPLVGPVLVAGLPLTSAEQMIHDESVRRGKFVNPNVSVLLLSPRTNRVIVVGAVLKPGTYDIPAGNSNLLAAIVAAEGLTEEASTVIEVRHPNFPNGLINTGPFQNASFTGQPALSSPSPRALSIDLSAGLNNPSDVQVEDGTTVMVRPREKQYVFVNGLVRKPDRYELAEGQELRLLDALALAGGRTLELADKVQVIRQVEDGQEPVVILASVNEAKSKGSANIRLAPGDLITVEETPLTFVVGTIREFVRFGFTSAIPGF